MWILREGYCDILLEVFMNVGVVIEMKYAQEAEREQAACTEALKQIEQRSCCKVKGVTGWRIL